MMTRLGVASLLCLLSTAACSAPTELTGSSESNQTEARSLGVIKGREYAKCWFDLVDADAQLSCTATARGNDPLKGVTVEVFTTGGGDIIQRLDIEAGGTSVVGRVPASSFPRTLTLSVKPSLEARHVLGYKQVGWAAEVELADASKLPLSAPLTIGQPFDFWEIGMVFGLTRGGSYSFKTNYSQPSAPYFINDIARGNEMTFEPELGGGRLGRDVSFIAAPKASGALPVHHVFHPQGTTEQITIETSLPGPGYWTITDDGIRAATTEEISKQFGQAGTTEPVTTEPVTTEPVTTEPVTTEPVTTEPVWVDPDPSCGGHGQATCRKDNVVACDPGTRNNNGYCSTCGTNGLQACYADPNGASSTQGYKCAAGTRNNNGYCSTCGTSGLQACYADPNGASSTDGYKCAAGLRNNNGYCSPCGTNGLQACYADPNGGSSAQGYKCEPGTRNNNGYCSACGTAGIQACYADPNGASSTQGYTCNDGLRNVNGYCAR